MTWERLSHVLAVQRFWTVGKWVTAFLIDRVILSLTFFLIQKERIMKPSLDLRRFVVFGVVAVLLAIGVRVQAQRLVGEGVIGGRSAPCL